MEDIDRLHDIDEEIRGTLGLLITDIELFGKSDTTDIYFRDIQKLLEELRKMAIPNQ